MILCLRPLSIKLPANTIRNGSLYLHVVITKLKATGPLNRDVLLHRSTSMATTPLTKYAVKQDKAFNLLSETPNESKDKSTNKRKSSERPVTHWKPKLTLNIISEPLSLSQRALPGEIAPLLKYRI